MAGEIMTIGGLLAETSSAIPGFTPAEALPIEKGGSSRSFYRLRESSGRSLILIQDQGEKEENAHYAALARFLSMREVPVPRVVAETPGKRLLWLEDLGEQDLWALRNEPWSVRRPLYESTLDGISAMHRIAGEEASSVGLVLQRPFDEGLYRWEQEYFVEHCLGGIFGIPEKRRTALLETPEMHSLASGLASLPRTLVHRDFQSQNIIVRDGRAHFIDFQGMRPGLPQYDLASLLLDPYVVLTGEERDHLLGYYHGIVASADLAANRAAFERIFWQCAAQRLMQALGAYGFLSIHRGKPAFRAHVEPALKNLREVLYRLHPEDRLEALAEIVK